MKEICHCEENYEYHEFIDCISSALDARDPYTGNHSQRVSDMACMLCGYMGLTEVETVFDGIGRMGVLPQMMTPRAFADTVSKSLGTAVQLREGTTAVRTVALVGGAGGDYVRLAVERGCDTYVTSDIKYNRFLEAEELCINLIDADHFCTENPVIPVLRNYLAESFADVEFLVSKAHGQVVSFF